MNVNLISESDLRQKYKELLLNMFLSSFIAEYSNVLSKARVSITLNMIEILNKMKV